VAGVGVWGGSGGGGSGNLCLRVGDEGRVGVMAGAHVCGVSGPGGRVCGASDHQPCCDVLRRHGVV